MNSKILVLFVLFFYLKLNSQVINLSDYPGTFYEGSDPAEFTPFNGKVFFSAKIQTNGNELWVTDGTQAGTKVFLEIGRYFYPGNPRNLTIYNGELYFIASDGYNKNQIWKTDGTDAGTVMVTKFPSEVDPTNLIVANGLLFFRCALDTYGYELWKYDGANYSLVKDIDPASYVGSITSQPAFAATSTHLYFTCNDGVHGKELWVTDGTTAGTVLALDINPGTASAFDASNVLIAYNDQVCFPAITSTYGAELWKSDGTSGGTSLLSDINSGTGSSAVSSLTISGSSLFFSANNTTNGAELWKTDGTSVGTVIVKDIYTGTSSSSPASLYNVGGTLYFSAINTGSGREFYKSDGTNAGTVLIKDLISGTSSGSPGGFRYCNGSLYFQASYGGEGVELWKSDGTNAGTQLLKATLPGLFSGSPRNFTPCSNGNIVFEANGPTDVNNNEVWVSDGTTAGTNLLRNICADEESPVYKTLFNNENFLFYDGVSATYGRDLYFSNGTPSGTTLLKDIYAGSNNSTPYNFIEFDSTVYFFAQTSASNFNVLHKTNGTTAGTIALSGNLGNIDGPVFIMDSTLYFFSDNGASTRLFKVNESAAPTFITTVNGSFMTGFSYTVMDTVIYYSLNGSSIGNELYRSNGSAGGSYAVKNIYAGSFSSNPNYLVNLNGSVIFAANEPTNGTELWISNGTSAGTVLLKDIYPGTGSGNPTELFVWENKVFFTAEDPVNGRELWSTDGTSAGTHIEYDIEPGIQSSNPMHFNKGPEHFWFSANKQETGRELWIKKTGQAPALVNDIYPGPNSSNPGEFKVINNLLYFGANNGVIGYEPYSTIQSGCSTTLLEDLNPGDLGSYPQFYGSVNEHIILYADKAGYGRELFSLEEAEQVLDEVSSCINYTWPLTNEVFTTSGSYVGIGQDQSGCDSLVNLVLTITQSVSYTDTIASCGPHTWVDGITYNTSTNTPTHTFSNSQGCDSIVTLNLTVLSPTSATDIQTHCGSYTWINGVTYNSSTNTPTHIFTNSQGCDSIVTLNLTILNPSFSTTTINTCDSYTWTNGMSYSSSGTFTQTLLNSAGCDSIATLSLNINNSSSSTINISSCGSYYWDLTQTTYTASGNYVWNTQNTNGCDSTILLDLSISSVPNAQISDNGQGILTASGGTVTQWIDCSNNTAIQGANTSVYNPAVNGSYAAVVYDSASGCSDTSGCIVVDYLQIGSFNYQNIQLYPNPTNDLVTIQFDGNNANYTVYDAQGKLIQTSKINSGGSVSLKDVQTGVYFFELTTESGIVMNRIVKN